MDLSSVLATVDCGQAITLLLSTVMIEISLEFCNTEVFAVRGIFLYSDYAVLRCGVLLRLNLLKLSCLSALREGTRVCKLIIAINLWNGCKSRVVCVPYVFIPHWCVDYTTFLLYYGAVRQLLCCIYTSRFEFVTRSSFLSCVQSSRTLLLRFVNSHRSYWVGVHLDN